MTCTRIPLHGEKFISAIAAALNDLTKVYLLHYMRVQLHYLDSTLSNHYLSWRIKTEPRKLFLICR